jgi:NADPH:quinone reductase
MAAIQLGKHVGAKVIATTSGEEKARRLRELGADKVIDYTNTDFVAEVMHATDNRGVDVVLEMIGGDIYQKSLEVLAPGGRLVSIGGAFGKIPDTPPSFAEGRKASRFSITNYLKAHPEGFKRLDALLQSVRDGKFKVVIGRSFPLAETRAAQRFLEGRDHFGKIVLKP